MRIGVGQLLISNPLATLAINTGQNLFLTAGPQFANDGVILVNPTAAGSGTQLRIDTSLTLSGTGELRLNAHPANLDTAYINQLNNSTLTQAAGHRIVRDARPEQEREARRNLVVVERKRAGLGRGRADFDAVEKLRILQHAADDELDARQAAMEALIEDTEDLIETHGL